MRLFKFLIVYKKKDVDIEYYSELILQLIKHWFKWILSKLWKHLKTFLLSFVIEDIGDDKMLSLYDTKKRCCGVTACKWYETWLKCLILSLDIVLNLGIPIKAITVWKVSVFGVILVSIFPHSDRIRTRIRTLFTQWYIHKSVLCRSFYD